jgi:hypothetical protein
MRHFGPNSPLFTVLADAVPSVAAVSAYAAVKMTLPTMRELAVVNWANATTSDHVVSPSSLTPSIRVLSTFWIQGAQGGQDQEEA